MPKLKILPFVALFGAASVVAVGATKLIDKLVRQDLYDMDESDMLSVLQKMKRIQNELARLSDLKDLNDRRESTHQISKATLQVEGVEINDLISKLTEELNRLTKKYNKMKKKDGVNQRKKK